MSRGAARWAGTGSALAAALLAVGALALLRPFDRSVAAWADGLGAAGGTGLWLSDYALRGGLVLLVIAAAAAAERRAWALGGALLVIATGNLAAEVLKTVIERARPSAGLGAAGGNSLPSGHVMGCTVTALVAVGLLRQGAWPRWLRLALGGLALVAVAGEALTRILRGSHWLSDVGASVLLGAAFVLAARQVAASGGRAVAAALAALAASYALVYHCPALRLHVP